MVSLQTMVSMEKSKQCFDLDLTITSKKRKRDEEEEKDDAASGGLDLHLDIPLPIEWERCLDIKVVHVFFLLVFHYELFSYVGRLYNTLLDCNYEVRAIKFSC